MRLELQTMSLMSMSMMNTIDTLHTNVYPVEASMPGCT